MDGEMENTVTADKILDCRGASCPIPILQAKKAMTRMKSGQILEILSSDPGTRNDLPGVVERDGHKYLGHKPEGSFTRFYVQLK
ncbi:MAG: sulfurtransferase TusA family protein [Deltaproteobacteria bacterium]|nr:sulfurtransferase TusA family protein [Deltaproteobacteria bacterium]MBW1993228.1 sulfurtransferase TusA family protein [Deltaproteobacteria bacterium]MBW2154134.1 sulfurtransferase TusA family protein [Deltaproteobacteria bacterium]